MKAMILAAGLGTRMRPLTDHTPKPLLPVGGKPLIVWHIEKLAANGFQDIIINIAWLGWQIPEALGDGSRWGVRLHYSDEQQEGALETAGGIIKALPLLGEQTFLLVNGDVWCDYPCLPKALPAGSQIHLVMVDNPTHHPQGDFVLNDGKLSREGQPRLTYSGIGYYSPVTFTQWGYGRQALLPVMLAAMERGQVTGEHHQGSWLDIGTPQRLEALNRTLGL